MTDLSLKGVGSTLTAAEWNVLYNKLTSGVDSINTGSVVAQSAILTGAVQASTGSFIGSVVSSSYLFANGSFTGSLNINRINASTGSIIGSIVGGALNFGTGSFTGSVVGGTLQFSNGSLIGSLVGTSLAFSNGSITGSLVGATANFTGLFGASTGSFGGSVTAGTANFGNGSIAGSVIGTSFVFGNGSLTGSIQGVSANFTGNLNVANSYAIGSYVVSGTTNNNKVMSPAGTGSPTTWAKLVQAGSTSVGAGSQVWTVFGTGFTSVPGVTLGKYALADDFWLIPGSLNTGSMFVQGKNASTFFNYIAIG